MNEWMGEWVKILSLSDSLLQTRKIQVNVLNSTCQTISVWKLLQIENFNG